MQIRHTVIRLVVLLGWCAPATWGGSSQAEIRASQILDATGVRAGLIVHIGCGDGQLAAALGAKSRALVHGLDEDSRLVEKARQYIASHGLAGRICVDRWSSSTLPYVDNLVNLLIVSGRHKISDSEIRRVLRPGGMARMLGAYDERTIRKAWPEQIDDWTHFLHDASGNAVSSDELAGPPRRMQWVASPQWSRNHHTLASISSVVTTKGRLFYVVDEATAGSMLVPGRWYVAARDAFNGTSLWKRSMSSWAWERHKFRSGPVQLPRLLVASDERVYVPLGLDEAVSALDARTGKVVTSYEQTNAAEEMILSDGVLLVVKGAPVSEQAAVHPEREVKKNFTNAKSIVAIAVDTAKELWTWSESKNRPLMPVTLAAKDGRVFFQAGEGLTCLNLASGDNRWDTTGQKTQRRNPGGGKRQAGRALGWATATLVVHEDLILWTDGNTLRALSVADGEQVWECPCKAGFKSAVDVFVADGLVWVGPDYNVGRDLRSGEIKRELLGLDDLRTVGHHHRCYREKATERFIIGGYRGMEFFDLIDDNHSRNNWVRGTCQYGVMPANGLMYAPSHACGCYMEAKLIGFWALAGQGEIAAIGDKAEQLQKGPAYALVAGSEGGSKAYPANQWPTYRHDSLRSGSTASAVPSNLKPAWRAKVGDLITAPVIAEGTVIVSAIDDHRVVALDAEDGSVRWSFTAGGRVDSPPTLHASLVLFGCADGYVYCLRLADGEVAWRFRAARRDVRTVAYDRLESVWPVHGSVLVLDGVAYATAGRSSYLDGGIDVYGLSPQTGKVLHHNHIESSHPDAEEGLKGPADMNRKFAQNATDPKTFQSPDLSDAFSMAGGTTTDVLVSDGTSVFLRTMRFDRALQRQTKRARHLYSTSSLLDGNENHRSHVVIGTGDFSRMPVAYSWIANRPAGSYGSAVVVPYGVALSFTDDRVWGIRRLRGYTLYSRAREPFTGEDDPLPDVRAVPEDYKPSWDWSSVVDVRPRALVRAGDLLLIGGMTNLDPDANSPDAFTEFEGRGKGVLWIASAENGEKLAGLDLEAAPVWDGMAVADGRLYVSRVDGIVQALAKK